MLGSCVADEAVTVDVEVVNPLQVSRSRPSTACCATHVLHAQRMDLPTSAPCVHGRDRVHITQIALELTQLRAICQLRELPSTASGGSGTLPQPPPLPLAAVAAVNHTAASAATTAAAHPPPAAGEAVETPPGESLVELEKVTDALAASALAPRDNQPSAQPPDAAGPRPASGSEGAADSADAGIVFGEQSLTLRGGERVRLRLQLWPRRPGLLTVDGIAWVLADVAHGQRLFSLRHPAPSSKCASMSPCMDHHVCFMVACMLSDSHLVQLRLWIDTGHVAMPYATCTHNPSVSQVGEGLCSAVTVTGSHPCDAASGRGAGGPAAGAHYLRCLN